jgi:hypothetical protein
MAAGPVSCASDYEGQAAIALRGGFMISRREVVTAGVLGTLTSASAAAAGAAPVEAEQGSETQALVTGFNNIVRQLDDLKAQVNAGLVANSLRIGGTGAVNERIERYLRTSGKFPEFCDIGTGVFYDVYEWHVKHQQQIQITRVADQRLAIQFMFTQLILRWENEPNYVGTPFDR